MSEWTDQQIRYIEKCQERGNDSEVLATVKLIVMRLEGLRQTDDDMLTAALWVCAQQAELWGDRVRSYTRDFVVSEWRKEVEKTLKQGYLDGWGTDGFPWKRPANLPREKN